MRRLFLSTLLGCITALLLFTSSFAQESEPDYEDGYVTQAMEYIRQVETAYIRAKDYLLNGDGTNEDNQAAFEALGQLEDLLMTNEPPTAAAAIHHQIRFALRRCQNFVWPATYFATQDTKSLFAEIHISQLREYCIVQINEAKLRLLDYASAHDVNLFVPLNEAIVITYTTEITTSAPITANKDADALKYVILEKETDKRLSLVVVEGIRSDNGNFALHVELEPSADISSGGVSLRCYGEQQKILCSIGAILRLEPSGLLVDYIETDVPFEDVEWVELYWQGKD